MSEGKVNKCHRKICCERLGPFLSSRRLTFPLGWHSLLQSGIHITCSVFLNVG